MDVVTTLVVAMPLLAVVTLGTMVRIVPQQRMDQAALGDLDVS